MKKTPFTLLKEAIENELLNTSLSMQKSFIDKEQINPDFYLGYTEALKLMLMHADYIYHHGKPL